MPKEINILPYFHQWKFRKCMVIQCLSHSAVYLLLVKFGMYNYTPRTMTTMRNHQEEETEYELIML